MYSIDVQFTKDLHVYNCSAALPFTCTVMFFLNRTLIGKVCENARNCSELVGLLEEKRKLDIDILQQRLKYTNLVNSITNKWKAIENLTLTDASHTPQVKK